MIFAAFATWIYRSRHLLLDRDPELAESQDRPAVRHIRIELVLLAWGVLSAALLSTLYPIWRS